MANEDHSVQCKVLAEKIKELKGKTTEAKLILFNTCDVLPCPSEDVSCLEVHENFLRQLKTEFVLSAQQQVNSCVYYVFDKREGGQ